MLEQRRRKNAEVGVCDEDVDMRTDEEASGSDSDPDTEFPTTLMTFQPASLHKAADFEKLDKKVRCFPSQPLKEAKSNGRDRKFAKKKKAELASLGEWTHIDCVQPSERRSEILDGALQVLLGQQKMASPIASDDEMEDMSLHSVPPDTRGGTIAFLFEKSSSAAPGMDSERVD